MWELQQWHRAAMQEGMGANVICKTLSYAYTHPMAKQTCKTRTMTMPMQFTFATPALQ